MATRITPSGLQSYDPLKASSSGNSKPEKSQSQLSCEAKGGRWDEETQTCILPEKKTAVKQTGTARRGAEPNFRTTVQGDRFDFNKPISSKDFSSKESYEQAKKIKIGMGGGGLSDTGDAGVNEIEKAQLQAIQAKQEGATEAIEGASREVPEEITQELTAEEQAREAFRKPFEDPLGFVKDTFSLETLKETIPLALGVGAIGPAIGQAAPTAVVASSYLGSALTTGTATTTATSVLAAPSKAVAGAGAIKTGAIAIIAFSGLGSIKKVSSDLLTKKVEKIEAETTKAGEQLTKIPEAAALGFAIDENGKVYEYTNEQALKDINEVEDSLMAAEVALQTASIGRLFLKITGKYNTAQLEIDKQRREITVARGKVLQNIAVPSETLLKSREFWRNSEMLA